MQAKNYKHARERKDKRMGQKSYPIQFEDFVQNRARF